MICNVRMALRLNPSTGMISIRGLGDDKRTFHLRLEQLFAAPWAKSVEQETLFRNTVTELATMVTSDVATSMLYQLVALFHSSGLSLSDRMRVEQLQEKYADLLHQQLRTRLGDKDARSALSRFMYYLTDLRKLSDMLTEDDGAASKS